jgi:hypothetical protein
MANRGTQSRGGGNQRGQSRNDTGAPSPNTYRDRRDDGGMSGSNRYSANDDRYSSLRNDEDRIRDGRDADRYSDRNGDRNYDHDSDRGSDRDWDRNRSQYSENRRDHGMRENQWDHERNQRFGNSGRDNGSDREDWNERNGRNASSGYDRNHQGGYSRSGAGGGYNEGGYDNRGTSGGDFGQDQRRSGRDEHAGYREFRDRQMRKLDDDYDAYRTENRRAFDENHFDDWRSDRSQDKRTRGRARKKATAAPAKAAKKASAGKGARAKTPSTRSADRE